MSEFKGTPGPWVLNYDKVSVAIPHRGPSCVTHTYAGNEANARLIAAAPDLYHCADLLESLCAWMLHRFGPDSPEGREASFRLNAARNAIAKALQS